MTSAGRSWPAGRGPGARSGVAQLSVAAVAVALAAADTYVVVLALPDMMAGVGLGIESLQRATPIVSGFLVGYICVLPLVGRISDLVSRRRVLLGCLAVFVAGSVGTALAVELPVLVGGRVLQGVGGGGLVPATLALVADLWPPGRRGTPLGVVGAVQELGSLLGPLLGAAVLAVADWRAIFWVNAAAGCLVAALLAAAGREPSRIPPSSPTAPRAVRPSLLAVTRRLLLGAGLGLAALALWAPERLTADLTWGVPFVPVTGTGRLATPIGAAAAALLLGWAALAAWRSRGLISRVDLPGAAFVATALGCVVLTFASADPQQEVAGPWGAILLPLAAAAVAGAAARHRTAAHPLLHRGIGRVWLPVAVSALAGVALVAVVVGVPLLARVTTDGSQTEAALLLVRFLLAVPAGAVAGGMLLRRLGAGSVAAPGLLAVAVALAAMSRWGEGSVDPALPTTLLLLLAGLGVGLAIAPVNAAALERGPGDAHGVVSAVVVVARMTGMVVGLALVTAVGLRLFTERVADLPPPVGPAELAGLAVVPVQVMFAGGAAAALVAAVLAVPLGIRKRSLSEALTAASTSR